MSVTFFHDLEQRSDAWFAVRAGLLTGSVAKHVDAERKKGTGDLKGRLDLRNRLVGEILTARAKAADEFVSNAMRRGELIEPQALLAYEAARGVIVRPSGFIRHDSLLAGCSLDGYIGNLVDGYVHEGIVEVKCPNSDTHLGYWQAGGPDAYTAQAAHNLWISGAQWCDFVSYDDRFVDPALHLFIVRRTRAEVDVEGYAAKAVAFLAEVERDVAAMRTLANPLAVLQAAVALSGAAS